MILLYFWTVARFCEWSILFRQARLEISMDFAEVV